MIIFNFKDYSVIINPEAMSKLNVKRLNRLVINNSSKSAKDLLFDIVSNHYENIVPLVFTNNEYQRKVLDPNPDVTRSTVIEFRTILSFI